MKQYDVVIIGGATSGSFLARRLAEAGRNVLVLEAKPEEKVGTKYDIFHIGEPDFARFGLPLPQAGEDLAFKFTGGTNYSAFDKHPKPSGGTVIGMHMHLYTLRMNRWAIEAGAKFLYGARFVELLYTDGRISGLVYEQDGQSISVGTKLVADCSGIPSVVRRQLPDGYGVENFEITSSDMFYVILRYVRYLDEKDYIKQSRSWPFYKTWEAPQEDQRGAILGVGANLSFETGEQIYKNFETAVRLPRHELQYIERGATPYRRPPYSFIADGFLVSGDAACLTKPSAGEGVTSSMVQLEISAQVIGNLLAQEKPLSRENLWTINKRYNDAQGKAFANQMATLVGAVATSDRENDFFFEKDVIFSKKSFEAMGEGKELRFSTGELLGMAGKMLGGILCGRLRLSTVRALLRAMQNGNRIASLYAAYPETPEGFNTWCTEANAQWMRCGSMVDALQQSNTWKHLPKS